MRQRTDSTATKDKTGKTEKTRWMMFKHTPSALLGVGSGVLAGAGTECFMGGLGGQIVAAGSAIPALLTTAVVIIPTALGAWLGYRVLKNMDDWKSIFIAEFALAAATYLLGKLFAALVTALILSTALNPVTVCITLAVSVGIMAAVWYFSRPDSKGKEVVEKISTLAERAADKFGFHKTPEVFVDPENEPTETDDDAEPTGPIPFGKKTQSTKPLNDPTGSGYATTRI